MIIGILGEAGSGKDTVGKLLVEHHGFYALAFADPLKLFCQWMFNWTDAQLWGPSEHRNAPDEALPFVRCPHCGHFSQNMTEEVLESSPDDSLFCSICSEFAVQTEWRTALSPRFALQHLGTEWARTLNSSCHLDFALRRAQIVSDGSVHHDPLWEVLPYESVRRERWWSQKPLVRAAGILITDCRFINEVEAIQATGGRVFRVVREQRDDNTTSGIAAHASEREQRQIKNSVLDGTIDNNGSLLQLSATVARLAAQLEQS